MPARPSVVGAHRTPVYLVSGRGYGRAEWCGPRSLTPGVRPDPIRPPLDRRGGRCRLMRGTGGRPTGGRAEGRPGIVGASRPAGRGGDGSGGVAGGFGSRVSGGRWTVTSGASAVPVGRLPVGEADGSADEQGDAGTEQQPHCSDGPHPPHAAFLCPGGPLGPAQPERIPRYADHFRDGTLCPDRPKRNRDRCDQCATCGGREPILGFPARPWRARPTAGAVAGFHGRS